MPVVFIWCLTVQILSETDLLLQLLNIKLLTKKETFSQKSTIFAFFGQQTGGVLLIAFFLLYIFELGIAGCTIPQMCLLICYNSLDDATPYCTAPHMPPP